MTFLMGLAVVLVVVLVIVSLVEHHNKQQHSERASQYQHHITQTLDTTRTQMQEASDSYLDHIRGITRR